VLYWADGGRVPFRFILALHVRTAAQSALEFVFGLYVMLPERVSLSTAATRCASMVKAHEPLESERVPAKVRSTFEPETAPSRCALPQYTSRKTAPAPPTSAEMLCPFCETVNGMPEVVEP
jgi:hypothetical protein